MKVADKIKAYTTASMTEADGKHIYRDSGNEPLPSASEILRIFSFGDYALVNQEKLDEAAHIGHAVHASIAAGWSEVTLRMDEMMFSDVRYHNSMKAYGSWLIANKNIVPLAVEKQFASASLGFGGTVDFIGKINGEMVLIDWKSTNEITFKHFIQLRLYSMLLEKCCGVRVKKMIIVHLRKDTGEFKVRECLNKKILNSFTKQVLKTYFMLQKLKLFTDGRRRIEI